MEITTGSPIGKLGLRDATTYVLEANGILSVGDILKHIKERKTHQPLPCWAEPRRRNSLCPAECGI